MFLDRRLRPIRAANQETRRPLTPTVHFENGQMKALNEQDTSGEFTYLHQHSLSMGPGIYASNRIFLDKNICREAYSPCS